MLEEVARRLFGRLEHQVDVAELAADSNAADLTGPDGPPAPQPALERPPERERDVDLVLKEVARRLLDRLQPTADS